MTDQLLSNIHMLPLKNSEYLMPNAYIYNNTSPEHVHDYIEDYCTSIINNERCELLMNAGYVLSLRRAWSIIVQSALMTDLNTSAYPYVLYIKDKVERRLRYLTYM